MNTPSALTEPAPTAVQDESTIWQAIVDLEARERCYNGTLAKNAREAYTRTLEALAAAQKRYEAAEAERAELANWIKRIHGQAEAAEAVIHGQKLAVDLEVAPTA